MVAQRGVARGARRLEVGGKRELRHKQTPAGDPTQPMHDAPQRRLVLVETVAHGHGHFSPGFPHFSGDADRCRKRVGANRTRVGKNSAAPGRAAAESWVHEQPWRWRFRPAVAGVPQFLEQQGADLTPYLSGDAIKDYPALANIPTRAWKNSGSVYNGKVIMVPKPLYSEGFAFLKNVTQWDAELQCPFCFTRMLALRRLRAKLKNVRLD